MLAESCQRLVWVALTHLPDHKFVVVTSTCYCHLVMWTPSEPANFLAMSKKLLCYLRGSNVTHKNCFILTSACYKWPRPCCSSHSMQVSSHRSNHFLMLDVPYLNLTIQGSNREIIASISLRPRDWGNLVQISQVSQLCDTWCVCIPNIHRVAKCHCKLILWRPVN